MSRETKSRINAQLRRLKREDTEQEYVKINLPKASDQLRAKLDTTIGRDLTEIGGIKPLDIVQNAKGDVIQGEGVALITENLPSISGANDPALITLHILLVVYQLILVVLILVLIHRSMLLRQKLVEILLNLFQQY